MAHEVGILYDGVLLTEEGYFIHRQGEVIRGTFSQLWLNDSRKGDRASSHNDNH